MRRCSTGARMSDAPKLYLDPIAKRLAESPTFLSGIGEDEQLRISTQSGVAPLSSLTPVVLSAKISDISKAGLGGFTARLKRIGASGPLENTGSLGNTTVWPLRSVTSR